EQVFWTPSPVISMYTQRGCPYVTDRCEFCAIPTGNNAPGSGLQRSAEKVAEDMEYFQKKHNTKYFSFGNETLTRKFMLALTEELDKRGLEAVIDGYTRTNQFTNGQLDTDMVKKISKYFRFLQIGFESANEETLDSMKKGRKPFMDSELAKALFENNVYAHAFLMTGFPPKKEKYEGKGRDEYVNFHVRSGIETLKWLLDNQYSVGTYKNTKLVLPRDSKMVEWKDGKAILLEKHSHEIVLRQHRDLEYNIPYGKINGSKKLDDAMTALFDLVQTPYRAFTHNAIYHQRQFMWDEGIRWSLENPDVARELFPISEERAKKVLKKLWNAAVGQDYISAVEELKRIEGKGGINAERKREHLQKTIDETREKNTMAKRFPKPDGLQSIEDLVELAA
ncbi:MAG: radical SAM protein, partial [Nanoarchaeota archaeon]